MLNPVPLLAKDDSMAGASVCVLASFAERRKEMIEKKPLVPERIRGIEGSFAFIEHRFLRDGFLQRLSHHELLVYFFLVLACDRQGISYYGYEKICSQLKLLLDDYILARDALMQRDLIAFDGRLFQVLSFLSPCCSGKSRQSPSWTTALRADWQYLLPLPWRQIMLDQRMIFEIHRLSHEGISLRRISAILGLSRQVVTKYLVDPAPGRPVIQRPANSTPSVPGLRGF